MEDLNKLIDAAAVEKEMPQEDLLLVDNQEREVLVKKKLITKNVLLRTSYDELVAAGLSEGTAKVVKMLFPGDTGGGGGVSGASQTEEEEEEEEEERLFVVTGPQRKQKDFAATSNITFEQLQDNIKKLWPFHQTVDFEVYTEGAIHDANKRKGAGYKSLAGRQLNQAAWRKHLRQVSATATINVVIKAKGKPFSAYNGMSDEELQQLVHERTKFFLLDGKPIFDDTYFEPPLEFADGETPVHWGPTHALPAKHSTGAGSTSSQHHNCPVCLTPVPTAALGQGALAARESLTGGEARAEASADSRQQEHQSHGMKLKHLVAILANAMVCLLQSLSTDDPGEEVMHRGFIDLVLVGALMLARSLKPKNSVHRLYMKAEHALAGSMAWGKVDYLLVYRALGIMVVRAKAAASLDSAWGQAFMELITMHEALGRHLDKVNVRNDKKRTAAEAFGLRKLNTYMLICNAKGYRIVLYKPEVGLWWSSILTLPLSKRTTADQLAPSLEVVIKALACALTRQMDWLDEGLASSAPELAFPPPEYSGVDVEDATKDYMQQQAEEKEDDPGAEQQEGL